MGARLQGRAAVVTGAGRGIGRAIAELLAAEGASVVVNDLGGNVDGSGAASGVADEVVAAIRARGGSAVASYDSVADYRAAERIIDTAVREFGAIDILVNNAGRAARKPATELSAKEWDDVIALNLTAVFRCSKNAFPYLKKRGGGSIVNLASIMGLSGGLFPNASYQASKGAVVNLTRALALEWAADNVRVNAVAPTFVRTELTVPIFSNPEVLKVVMAHTPLGRLPGPEEIGAAIVYLCSPAARSVTGIVLPVDSGYLAR
jgi:NAD(P)-dependent dehydrogenase (short-subunit alcohol dehydrogenase family)